MKAKYFQNPNPTPLVVETIVVRSAPISVEVLGEDQEMPMTLQIPANIKVPGNCWLKIQVIKNKGAK